MKPSISIFGCGWLGFPLACRLAGKGYSVCGSVTDGKKIPALSRSRIDPFVLVCDPPLKGDRQDEFFSSPILVITLPFRRKLADPQTYRRQIQSIITAADSGKTEFVIFTGSTSVYPKTLNSASEESVFTADNPRAEVLKKIEADLLNHPRLTATVIRLGGLIGPERVPGRFLSGEKGLPDPRQPVNLIHRDDAVGIIETVIVKNVRGEILNAVADKHPTRREFYTLAAQKLGVPPPEFSAAGQVDYKIATNDKVKNLLQYHFRFPDPLTMIDGDTSTIQYKLFMVANFILCFLGAALFLYFAVAIEKAGSGAEKLLNQWKEYDMWIVGGFAALCVVICIPFILRKR